MKEGVLNTLVSLHELVHGHDLPLGPVVGGLHPVMLPALVVVDSSLSLSPVPAFWIHPTSSSAILFPPLCLHLLWRSLWAIILQHSPV